MPRHSRQIFDINQGRVVGTRPSVNAAWNGTVGVPFLSDIFRYEKMKNNPVGGVKKFDLIAFRKAVRGV